MRQSNEPSPWSSLSVQERESLFVMQGWLSFERFLELERLIEEREVPLELILEGLTPQTREALERDRQALNQTDAERMSDYMSATVTVSASGELPLDHWVKALTSASPAQLTTLLSSSKETINDELLSTQPYPKEDPHPSSPPLHSSSRSLIKERYQTIERLGEGGMCVKLTRFG